VKFPSPVGVIPSGAVLQAEREPALSAAEGDVALISVGRPKRATVQQKVRREPASLVRLLRGS